MNSDDLSLYSSIVAKLPCGLPDMKKSFLGLFCLLLVPIASLIAQSDRVMVAPPGHWVEPQSFDAAALPPEGQEAGSYYLLVDYQDHAQLKEGYRHYVYKVLTSQGLQDMSDVSISFDPSYEQLTVHTLRIHREGKVLEQMPKTFRTMQREESMDRFIYDGTLTTVINLNDVRVGDVIEFAFTRKGDNPVNRGHDVWHVSLNYSDPTETIFRRIIVPESLAVYLHYTNTDQKPVITTHSGQRSYTWSATKIPALTLEDRTPAWHAVFSSVTLTTFANWGEVADWAKPLYTVKDADRKKLAAMAAGQFHAATPEAYTEEVIRFVQDEVRYLGFETGLNAHTPHAPLDVYNQRFGDCKDKALLLTTLLNARGIEAHPMLVNTSEWGHVSALAPSMYAFDHCVAQIKLNDSIFYVDATIAGQGGMSGQHYFPKYGKGLVIDGRSRDFAVLHKSQPYSIEETQTIDIDSIGGAGLLTVHTVYKGGEADDVRSQFYSSSREEIQKKYLKFYGDTYPDIAVRERLRVTDQRDSNRVVVDEYYKIPTFWKPGEDDPSVLECDVSAQSIDSRISVSKFAQRTAPYRLSYPLNYTHTIVINVPEEWSVEYKDQRIDRDQYAYYYSRRYADRKVVITTHYETKEAEIPADQYQQYIDDHKEIRGNLWYSLTYNTNYTGQSVSSPTAAGLAWLAISFALSVLLSVGIYRRYDPKPAHSSPWTQPIVGNLEYARYVLVITAIILLTRVFTHPYLFSGHLWLPLLQSGEYGRAALYAMYQVYGALLIPVAVMSVLLFQRNRSSTPRVTSAFFVALVGIPLLEGLVNFDQDANGNGWSAGALIFMLLLAGIWIGYFYQSTQVKRTFVNCRREE
jgi:transglutaminase-like putative cysteine protease